VNAARAAEAAKGNDTATAAAEKAAAEAEAAKRKPEEVGKNNSNAPEGETEGASGKSAKSRRT
jgi:hypothetical protein